MGLGNLFIAAAMPVLKLLIVTAVGSLLATKRIGILGAEARNHLNNVLFYVFNPAFVYTNLSKTITFKSMLFLWFMPVNILLTFIFGTILGWAVIHITRPPSRLRGLVLGCCAGGNLGNIIIIILPAICKEKGGPFGAEDVCTKSGLAYASLSMAIGSVFLWSYVYNVVRISSTRRNKEGTENGTLPVTNMTEETPNVLPSDPISGQDPKMSGRLEDQREPESAINGQVTEKSELPILGMPKHIIKTISAKVELKKLLPPSIFGAIIGFFVGVIGPIRRVFVHENAPLRVIQASVALLRYAPLYQLWKNLLFIGIIIFLSPVFSDGAIPSLTIIMGGNLTKGIRKSGVRVSVVISIIVVRYILLPLLGVVVVKGAIRFGLIHKDPLYEFILLLQFTIPPAMALGVMTQLFGAGEGECSVIFLWTYALAVLAITLWSAFFMWLVSK